MTITLDRERTVVVRHQVDELTRRRFLGSGAALGAGLLIGGCADDGDDPADASPAPSATATSLRTSDFFGEVEVPIAPQRVVAADDTALGNLLDLGLRPVATAVNLNSVPKFLGDRIAGIEDISVADSELGVNLERLAALRPDLILAAGVEWAEDSYRTLSQVAPTFGYAYGYATSEQIRTNMLEIGRAVGKAPEARAQVLRLDSRVEAMRNRIADAGLAGEPISVLRVSAGNSYSLRHGSVESILMNELGMSRPANQRSIADFSTDVSAEKLDIIDAFALFLYVDSNVEGGADQLKSSPLWSRLDVVADDRVFEVDSGVWNGISLSAAHAILDDIERSLLPEVASAGPSPTAS